MTGRPQNLQHVIPGNWRYEWKFVRWAGLAFVELQAKSGKWDFDIKAETVAYPLNCLRNSAMLFTWMPGNTCSFIRIMVILSGSGKSFIDRHDLAYKVALVSSHGHTSFHLPPQMTATVMVQPLPLRQVFR
jgi:anhydro-N-acetylmuramic acid kinase